MLNSWTRIYVIFELRYLLTTDLGCEGMHLTQRRNGDVGQLDPGERANRICIKKIRKAKKNTEIGSKIH